MPRDILFNHDNARFSYRISALPVHEGRILLQCPPGTEDYAFIGGHVAFGETAVQTLQRELQEELHASCTVGDLLAVGEVFIDWGRCPDGSPRHCHQIGLYFLVDVDVSALPEGDVFHGYDDLGGERFDLNFLWVPLEQLREMTVYPPEVARHLLSGRRDVLHFTYTELPEDTLWP